MSKGKLLFLIVGETGSGKDSIAKEVAGEKGLVISYTTRPMREYETDGVQHWFVSDEEMDRIEKEETVIAWTKTGNIRYCATVEKSNGASVYIINPDGIRWFKENGPKDIEIITIGIYVPLEERRRRCEGRSDYNISFNKRVSDEQLDYANFRLNGEFDYMVSNKNLKTSVNIVKSIIEEETKRIET